VNLRIVLSIPSPWFVNKENGELRILSIVYAQFP